MKKWAKYLNRYLIRVDIRGDIQMASADEKMLNIIVTKILQINPSYHYIPIRMAKKQKILKIPTADQDTEQQEPSFLAGDNTNWYDSFPKLP